jgi:hypothetical protein
MFSRHLLESFRIQSTNTGSGWQSSTVEILLNNRYFQDCLVVTEKAVSKIKRTRLRYPAKDILYKG